MRQLSLSLLPFLLVQAVHSIRFTRRWAAYTVEPLAKSSVDKNIYRVFFRLYDKSGELKPVSEQIFQKKKNVGWEEFEDRFASLEASKAYEDPENLEIPQGMEIIEAKEINEAVAETPDKETIAALWKALAEDNEILLREDFEKMQRQWSGKSLVQFSEKFSESLKGPTDVMQAEEEEKRLSVKMMGKNLPQSEFVALERYVVKKIGHIIDLHSNWLSQVKVTLDAEKERHKKEPFSCTVVGVPRGKGGLRRALEVKKTGESLYAAVDFVESAFGRVCANYKEKMVKDGRVMEAALEDLGAETGDEIDVEVDEEAELLEDMEEAEAAEMWDTSKERDELLERAQELGLEASAIPEVTGLACGVVCAPSLPDSVVEELGALNWAEDKGEAGETKEVAMESTEMTLITYGTLKVDVPVTGESLTLAAGDLATFPRGLAVVFSAGEEGMERRLRNIED